MLLDHSNILFRRSAAGARAPGLRARLLSLPVHGISSVDLAIAAAGMLAVAVEGIVRAPGGTSPLAFALALLAGLALLPRTTAPLAALVLVEATAVASAGALHASWSATVIVVVQLYSVALRGGRLRSVVIGAFTAAAVTIAIVLIDGQLDPPAVATRLPLVFLSLAVGDTVRSRRELQAIAWERAERERREREEEMRRRAAAERLQIARELHDTLGHFLVAINVRAGVAVEVPDATDTASALWDIKRASAGALRELRATLSVLREQNDGAPTAPALDLAALPDLVQHARAAGLLAELELELGEIEVPSAIRGAAVRIVQEALTNVLRHAQATRVSVGVSARGGALLVEIVDDGTAAAETAPGFGLRGMAGRANALGGRFEAGPHEPAGWRVFAELPLDPGSIR